MANTIRSLFSKSSGSNPKKRTRSPSAAASKAKRKPTGKPSTSTWLSQPSMSTGTPSISNSQSGKKTQPLKPVKLVNPKACSTSQASSVSVTVPNRNVTTSSATFIRQLHDNRLLRIFEEESFRYVPDRENDSDWTDEVTLEPGQFFLCINTVIDSWIRSTTTGTSRARGTEPYVIVTEELMEEFELFKQDMLNKVRPNPSEAFLRSNEVIRRWMDEERITPYSTVNYKGEQYLSIAHDVVDGLCEWVLEARCRYPAVQ